MPYGLLAAAFLAVRVQGLAAAQPSASWETHDGGQRAMRGRAPSAALPGSDSRTPSRLAGMAC